MVENVKPFPCNSVPIFRSPHVSGYSGTVSSHCLLGNDTAKATATTWLIQQQGNSYFPNLSVGQCSPLATTWLIQQQGNSYFPNLSVGQCSPLANMQSSSRGPLSYSYLIWEGR
ncbi:hypothetical protein AAC387_Pa12g1412 [Persea americana]